MTDKISVERMGEILKALLVELKKAGGRARPKDLFAAAESKLNLTEYERQPYQKSGFIRWQTHARFYSIDCAKQWFLGIVFRC